MCATASVGKPPRVDPHPDDCPTCPSHGDGPGSAKVASLQRGALKTWAKMATDAPALFGLFGQARAHKCAKVIPNKMYPPILPPSS